MSVGVRLNEGAWVCGMIRTSTAAAAASNTGGHEKPEMKSHPMLQPLTRGGNLIA